METDPHRWIAAVRLSHDRLASLVKPLTPEQLRGPSYHDWSIAEVVGHLGSGAESFMGWIDAAIERKDPPGPEAMQPIWDAWNARSPEDKVRDGLAYDERVVQRFESLTGEELARMHLSLFGMELDAAGLARVRLSEHAVHSWDIAVALDPSAQVFPEAVDLLIDTLGFLAGRIGKPLGNEFRLHVHTTEPERDFSLRVGEVVALTEWEGGPADGELRIPAEAFLRLIYGRLDPSRRLQYDLTGPVPLDELRHIFPGV